jgi:hypothetical protein
MSICNKYVLWMTLQCLYTDAIVCNITVLEIMYLWRDSKPLHIIIDLNASSKSTCRSIYHIPTAGNSIFFSLEFDVSVISVKSVFCCDFHWLLFVAFSSCPAQCTDKWHTEVRQDIVTWRLRPATCLVWHLVPYWVSSNYLSYFIIIWHYKPLWVFALSAKSLQVLSLAASFQFLTFRFF